MALPSEIFPRRELANDRATFRRVGSPWVGWQLYKEKKPRRMTLVGAAFTDLFRLRLGSEELLFYVAPDYNLPFRLGQPLPARAG